MTITNSKASNLVNRDSWLYRFAASRLNLDVELRYRAVARLIKGLYREGDSILEVGAGSVSIGRYLRRRVVAVDPARSEISEPWSAWVTASGCALPFADRTWDVVCSIDMLEHIPEPSRGQVLQEIIRVSKKVIVLAVPTGSQAYEHDCTLNEYHVQQHGVAHRFGLEHVEFGLPDREKVLQLLSRAATESGRKLRLQAVPNNNLRLRSVYMKLAFHRSLLFRSMYVALYPFAYLGGIHHRGECYRTIFVGVFSPQ